MDRDFVYGIATAILAQAEKDYKNALKKGNGGRIREIQRFYLSDWGQTLSRGNGQNIINRIQRESKVNKPIKKKKRRNATSC